MKARMKYGLSGAISLDEMIDRGIGVILTEDRNHSVSDEMIRKDPDVHEHRVQAVVWWRDNDPTRYTTDDPRTIVAIQKALAAQAALTATNGQLSIDEQVDLFVDRLEEEADEPPEWRWLASTKELQERTYGYDYDQMTTQTKARYLDWNVSAAIQELAEVREEFSWKPWAVDLPFINRDRVRDEVIDALHFLGNILSAIGVSDAELQSFYMLKQAKNRARQASGTYSAQKGGIAEGSDI